MILAKQVSVAFVCSFLDAVRFRRVRGKADDGANPGRIQDIPEHLRATVRRYVLEHVHRNDDVVPSARDRLLSHVSNDVRPSASRRRSASASGGLASITV